MKHLALCLLSVGLVAPRVATPNSYRLCYVARVEGSMVAYFSPRIDEFAEGWSRLYGYPGQAPPTAARPERTWSVVFIGMRGGRFILPNEAPLPTHPYSVADINEHRDAWLRLGTGATVARAGDTIEQFKAAVSGAGGEIVGD